MDAPGSRRPLSPQLPAAQADALPEPSTREPTSRLAQLLSLARLFVALVIVVGCFGVILAPGDRLEASAAFSLLGVVTAWSLGSLSVPCSAREALRNQIKRT